MKQMSFLGGQTEARGRVRTALGTSATALLAGLLWFETCLFGTFLCGTFLCAPCAAQAPSQLPNATAVLPFAEPEETALHLPEDRGISALVQGLRQLDSFASVMAIVAHPDDEDGAMLTYESRTRGARASLLSLTRGEGGQNAMSADTYDALGLIRTHELLRADQFYGVHQYWGTEVDFGFSKTQREAFERWGHDRVLYDAVLAVRQERPRVITSTFIGGITDGHGHHQVAGEIAQEVFQAAGDPTVFPDQLAHGLRPWQPKSVYARIPFVPITNKGMFNYATGKWSAARFFNYVSQQWSETPPSADVTLPVGRLDPVLGRSPAQIARQGWGEQRSQNGGGNPTLSGFETSAYHLYASRWNVNTPEPTNELYPPASISWAGLATFLTAPAPAGLMERLNEIERDVTAAREALRPEDPAAIAPLLAAGYRHTLALRQFLLNSGLTAADQADALFEIDRKIIQFQQTLAKALGLDLTVFRTYHRTLANRNDRFGGGVDETPSSVTPGQQIIVRVHTTHAAKTASLRRVWVESTSNASWRWKTLAATVASPSPANPTSDEAKHDPADELRPNPAPKPKDSPAEESKPNSVSHGQHDSVDKAADQAPDQLFEGTVPDQALPTEPYFSRPSVEQAYYDLADSTLRGRSFAPYPLVGWAEYTYDGLPIRMGQVVQALARPAGVGGVFEPLMVTPIVGLRIDPQAQILPRDGQPLAVHVRVHCEQAAEGRVRLQLPRGWTAQPAEASFHLGAAGDAEPIEFRVTTSAGLTALNRISAEAEVNGRTYLTGWQSVGYSGLARYPLFRPATLLVRSVDATLPPGLRVGYVMGTGDRVPEALEGLGGRVHLLSASELITGDLSTWSTIVIGIRAYSVRPELTTAQVRLNEFVRRGGTLLVEYQSGNFPAPFPLEMSSTPERVVDEAAPVRLLSPDHPLLTWPNRITAADFDGWVEERGHGFMDRWDKSYLALAETADAEQDPQRGGLLVAHLGSGTYIYCAFALHRQLPELVPGAYRLLANLVSSNHASAGQASADRASADQASASSGSTDSAY